MVSDYSVKCLTVQFSILTLTGSFDWLLKTQDWFVPETIVAFCWVIGSYMAGDHIDSTSQIRKSCTAWLSWLFARQAATEAKLHMLVSVCVHAGGPQLSAASS